MTHELELHFLMNARVAVRLSGLRLLTAPAPGLDPETLTLEAPDNRRFGPGGTRLHYTRHAPGPAEAAAAAPLRIRNALGAVVRELPLAAAAGAHALAWDGRDAARRPVPPGVYVADAAGQHQRLVVTE